MQNNPSNELIKAVNTIYHDLEAETYDDRHTEIFKFERGLLQNIAGLLCEVYKSKPGILCLDVGSGTGNVPKVFQPKFEYQGIKSHWILSDISSKMLGTSCKSLSQKNCDVTGSVILDAEAQPFKEGIFDLITVNSVLHHLPEPKIFLERCQKILKVGGMLVISQEPRLGYYRSGMWNFAKIMRLPIKWTNRLFQARGMIQLEQKSNELFWLKVQYKLVEKGIVGMSQNAIISIVDIQSPTAKENIDPDRGFELSKIFNSDWEIYKMGTYAHLGKLALKNSQPNFWSWLDTNLGKVIPLSGSLFWIIAQKQ